MTNNSSNYYNCKSILADVAFLDINLLLMSAQNFALADLIK